jgi:hypothetical protein
VAVAALALVAVAARSGRTETLTPITTASSSPAATATRTGALGPTGPRTVLDEPADTSIISGVIVFALGLAMVLALLAVLLRRGRRGRPWGGAGAVVEHRRPDPAAAPQASAVVAQALAGAVEAGLRVVAEGESRDAVITCWVLLERAAAEAGTARRPAETSAELATRVLAQHRVSAAPLRRLGELYRMARYSTHPLGEDARAEARSALVQVRNELAGLPAQELA